MHVFQQLDSGISENSVIAEGGRHKSILLLSGKMWMANGVLRKQFILNPESISPCYAGI